jgi:hypothetical protein
MLQVLVPTNIPERVTLYEAVLWAAFNYFPAAEYTDWPKDRREDDEYNDSLETEKSVETDLFFTQRVCKKYDFPANPTAAYFEKEAELPFSCWNWERFKELEKVLDFPKEDLEKIRQEILEREHFETSQQHFRSALEAYLEIAKSQLFIELKKGKVMAHGREILEGLSWDNEEVDKFSLSPEDWFVEWEHLPELTSILPNDWTLNGIDWDSCCLKKKERFYCHVLVDFESLSHAFPMQEYETATVRSVNGILLLDDKEIATKLTSGARGRPSQYDWQAFTAEMAKRLARGTLPPLQESCIYEMQIWCKEQWKKSPSVTNLKHHIRPFYLATKSEKAK